MSEPESRSPPSPFGIAPEGYRLPPGTHLGRVRLQVADLGRSVNYYEEVLGLRTIEGGGGQAALLGTPGDGAALVELHERAGAAPVPRRGRLGLYHFAILLPDRRALARFAAHLAERGVGAGASDHRVSEAFYLHDPDGLGIEVYADRPRSSWRHEGGQLVMATDPLDLADLLREARGEPWGGMPEGTVIGHIHLHVGDLARAEAYYHQALGLDKTVWSYPGALFLSAGGYHHHLGLNTWAPGGEPAGEDEARLLEWELCLPSPEHVGEVHASLKSAGHPVEGGVPDGVARDPWGTRLRIRA